MSKKRIFTSFAIEDEKVRNYFVGQAKNRKVPYEIVDMSVKIPWDSAWKTNCRLRIKSCSGVIVLVTPNLKNADGAIWEIKCALDEKIPILGVYASGGVKPSNKPPEMKYITTVQWTWENISSFVNSL